MKNERKEFVYLNLNSLTVIIAFLVAIFWFTTGVPQAAWAQTTRAVVANKGSDDVTILKLADGSAVTIADPSFDEPRWVCISGGFAGVTNGGGNTVTWIDLGASPPSVLGTTVVGSRPRGIACNGDRAVVAVDDPDAGDDDFVKVIDISGLPAVPGAGQILASLNLGADANPEGVAMTRNGNFAAVAEKANDRVRYVNLTTNALLAGNTPVGNEPFGVATTPDNDTALVTNRLGDSLSIIDISGLPTVPGAVDVSTIVVGDNPLGVAVTSDGNKAVIAEAGSSDKARTVNLTDFTSVLRAVGGNPWGVAISIVPCEGAATPPCFWAAITNEADGTVDIVDLATNTVHSHSPVTVGDAPRGIAITPVRRPRAVLSATPRRVKVNRSVNFDGSGSTDDGTIEKFAYDFGDGSSQTKNCATDSTCATASHTYGSVGNFTASLVVTDDDGASSTNKAVVAIKVVANRPPVASFKARRTAALAYVFTDNSKDSDGTVTTFSWKFGDGGTSSDQNPSHTYSSKGTFTVELKVTDDDGATSMRTQKIAVR